MTQANLSNWKSTPYSSRAFHNIRQLLPCDEIANTPDNIVAFPVEHSSLENIPGFNLLQFLQQTSTDGFVVLHNGKIIYEFYDNGMTAHTPHILMSATKSVVGLITGMLHETGILNVDALVSDYIPEIAHTAYQGATIRHLLDMQAGVVFDENQLHLYEAAVGWDPTTELSDLHHFLSTTTGTGIPHGGAFRYVSPNTDLLGWVIERATEQPFAALVSTLLWKPMGAENNAYMNVDRKGAPQCTRGLCTTTRDLARIGQLMLQDGIIPGKLINDIAQNGDRDAWQKGEFATGFASFQMSYRNGWYVVHNEPGYQFAMGIYGQNLFVDKANRLVIAKLSSQPAPLDIQAIQLTHKAFAVIRQYLKHE